MSIFITIILNSFSGRLFISVLFGSFFWGFYLVLLIVVYSSVSSFCLILCACFYVLVNLVTSPSLEGMAYVDVLWGWEAESHQGTRVRHSWVSLTQVATTCATTCGGGHGCCSSVLQWYAGGQSCPLQQLLAQSWLWQGAGGQSQGRHRGDSGSQQSVPIDANRLEGIPKWYPLVLH